MNLLPSVEERQWLTHALEKLIAQRGAQLLRETPLVEPTNEWFPEKWSTTAAHGHRLAQRLLYYAGLGALRPTLSAFLAQAIDNDSPWDAGTAGWFAGIENGRVHFGLHVRQFSDPEAAAGVLAHEVAHAWRTHHHLVIEDRPEEELLTDVTTIVLGLGILTTNNTDRYRTSGTWSQSAWSQSRAGYLPPQAMAYLLALWCAARGKRDERRLIDRHLEPNQRACFRAALTEIDQSEEPVQEWLTRAAPSQPMNIVSPRAFVPYEPEASELAEPQRLVAPKDGPRTVYRTPRGGIGSALYIGTGIGGPFALIVGMAVFGETDMTKVLAFTAVVTIALNALLVRVTRRDVCSGCKQRLNASVAVCPGCEGQIARRVSARELKAIGLEEFDRRAVRDTDYEECTECQPEQPCARHLATERIGPSEPEPEEDAEEPKSETISFRGGRLLLATLLVMLLAMLAFAWWRQTHVPVYFDNAIGVSLTIAVDGETFPLEGRPAMMRRLAPGTHHLVLHNGPRIIESLDPTVRKDTLLDALLSPRFYVYNAGGAGIYERSTFVYSSNPMERVNETTLLGLDRWIEQRDAEYIFTEPPPSIASSKATRRAFITSGAGYRDLAYAWFQERRVDDAVRALKKGLLSNPCDEGMRQDIVAIRSATHETALALDESRAWAAQCDDSIAAHRSYAGLLPNDEARAIYQQRVAKNPNASNHYLYGRLLSGEPALAQFREALRLDPKLNWARAALGRELLQMEQDDLAYTTLTEAMAEDDVPSFASHFYAASAIATNHIGEAQTVLAKRASDDAWYAKLTLARAKHDWDQAKVLLTERERGQPTIETTVIRARLDVETGAAAASIVSSLRNESTTRDAAELIAMEDALANNRLAEAATTTGLPDEYMVYAAYAALLAHTPVAVTLKDAYPRDLLRAARGEITEAAVLHSSDETGDDMRAHAYFALGVHATTQGDGAAAHEYFRKSAARALTREFPYRVAVAFAAR